MTARPSTASRYQFSAWQHHLKDLLFKDGVYDPEETVEAFSHAEN
jgi:hypothetical protein